MSLPRRWWANAWLRAGVLQPALYGGPWVGFCLLLAYGPESHIEDVAPAFLVGPLAALYSLGRAIATARSGRWGPYARVLLVVVALVGNGVALVLGALGWYHAAVVACHGTYECPF